MFLPSSLDRQLAATWQAARTDPLAPRRRRRGMRRRRARRAGG